MYCLCNQCTGRVCPEFKEKESTYVSVYRSSWDWYNVDARFSWHAVRRHADRSR